MGTLAVVFLAKVHGLPRLAVGGNHLKGALVVEKGVEVERQILVRKFVVKQCAVNNSTLCHQMAYANIIITCQIVDI